MTEQFHCLACKSPFSKMRLENGGEESRGGSEGS
jgi:hypothetical protein